ncbi:hypothetical protein [Streptomyces albipurpureus]|uniref:Uncharacterized protein n=1 Tax=Streptomyces albipurpureus TaxID=2897419 RepID=A0ABT0UY80_9ACTN|nr:hypothetical protein [Streptomyces sp. CWNU-1]MCM2392605.1 hypothetical protein [Streptomyces sp. CWNU-1]
MKIAVVSSAALLTRPWNSLHHMPLPAPSDLVQDLVRSHRLLKRLQQSYQAEGTTDEWQSAMRIVTDAAAARARTSSSHIVKIRQLVADKTYLIGNGLCHEDEL